jgi:DNA-binding HxlR family transcriptional regulator
MTAAGGCDAGAPGQFEDPDGEVSQNLINRLAPLRRQWDLAVLANQAAGTERSGDLIEAINAQASDGHRIGWRVPTDTLRRLERSGYVARQEMPGAARDRYRLLPPGHRPVSALSLLDTWYDDHEPGDDTPARHPASTRRGTRTTAAGPGAAPPAHSLTVRDTRPRVQARPA